MYYQVFEPIHTFRTLDYVAFILVLVNELFFPFTEGGGLKSANKFN